MDRRQFISSAAATLGLAPVAAWLVRPAAANKPMSDERFPVRKSADQWRAALSGEQYHVLREHGTERAGTSPLNHEQRAGTFRCAGCGQPLFESAAKFESGTGWPSF